MAFKRVGLPLVLMLLFLFTLVSGVFAIEVPPTTVPTFIQTNGPNAAMTDGDWYSDPENGVVRGYHYFTINVPPGWPAGTPIAVDLFSPEINTTGSPQQEQVPGGAGTEDDTQFELYNIGTTVGPAPDVPGPSAPGSLIQTTYNPETANPQQWVRFFVINPPTPGTYVLRAATLDNDQNSWRLRVGWDNDADPNNAPPAGTDDFDQTPGTNDEITIGAIQTTYQHEVMSPPVNQCLTLFEYVSPGSTSAVFHNFDMDNNQRVTYYAPSDVFDPSGLTGGTGGTVSGNNAWNNGTSPPPARGAGDVIANPESGWWRIVTCVNVNNQYIQEAQDGIQAFFEQPPTPQMTIVKDDGLTTVNPGQQITYTITFSNTSSGATAGAANNVIITDTLPANATFVSATINAPFTGTVTPGAGTVTININETVNAGASGTVTFVVQVDGGATGQVINTAQLDYQDGLGNQFAPVSDNDTDDIVQPPPGSVSGVVFNDTNGNGVQDPGETGIPNISVTVTGPSGTFNLVTDGSGNYSQTGLTPGSYDINVDETDSDLPSGATLTTGNDPATVTVPSGGNATADFGFTVVQPGSVSGVVYDDTNGNGVQDPGELGIPNISVTVTGPSGTFNLVTDGSGNYSQTGLTPGNYTVDVDTADPDLPTGAALTTGNDPATVTVPSGGNATADFGFTVVQPGSISGTVFNDTNGNGVQDPGETGIPNISVTISGPSGTFTVTTDANGFYIQTGLNPGSYTVDVDGNDPDMPPGVNLTTGNDPATVVVPQGGGGVANFGYAPASVAIQPTLSVTDPFITKSVNPPFALPGEQVTWTITVTNPGTVPATNVNVSDTLPGEVEIQSVNASAGTISFSGQTVTFTMPSLGAGQVVVITVVTRVRDDAQLPFTITNLATLTNAENPTPRTAQATVVSAGQLPQTGEANQGRILWIGLISAAALYASFRWFRNRQVV